MNASRRRVGRLFARLARTVAVGSLAAAGASWVASCSSSVPAATAESDSTARVAAAEPADTLKRQAGGVLTLRNECTECHPRTHDAVLGRGPAASAKCGECHQRVHEEIQALYAGTSHPAVRADPMFVARVQCAECHTDTTLAGSGAVRMAALDRACTSCHGPKYAGILARWTAGIHWRTRAASEYVSRAAANGQVTVRSPARLLVREAQQAVALVTTAGGIHNVRGADALLRAALDSTDAAYRAARVAVPGRPVLGPDPERVSCAGCHYGIETARSSVFGESFGHGAHVLRGNVACHECHSAVDYLVPGKHEVDKRHGRTMLSAASCNTCHHDARSTLGCVACHTNDAQLDRAIVVNLPLRLRQPAGPTSRAVPFKHADHAGATCVSCHTSRAAVRTVVACATCHEPHHQDASQCTTCHGTDLRAAHKAADHLACTTCHLRETVALLTPDRTFCVSCHTDRANHKTGRECSTCHMQSTPSELRQRILSGKP